MIARPIEVFAAEPGVGPRFLAMWRRLKRSKAAGPTPEQEERDAREQGAIAAAVEGVIP